MDIYKAQRAIAIGLLCLITVEAIVFVLDSIPDILLMIMEESDKWIEKNYRRYNLAKGATECFQSDHATQTISVKIPTEQLSWQY